MDANAQITRLWWRRKRIHYNAGLIISGVIAFQIYNVWELGTVDYSGEFGDTILEMALAVGCYLFMMGIANVFYSLGFGADVIFNSNNSYQFRERLFSLGFWFSFALPILLISWAVTR